MRQRLLTELLRTRDLDYVESFQTLAGVNLEMRRHGPSAERLLRKSILEMDVGNYGAALLAAEDAIVEDPRSAEAHFQSGMAHILLASVRAGAIPAAAGSERPKSTVSEHLKRARDSFEEAVDLNPGDQEAAADLAALRAFLSSRRTESRLADGLRQQAL